MSRQIQRFDIVAILSGRAQCDRGARVRQPLGSDTSIYSVPAARSARAMAGLVRSLVRPRLVVGRAAGPGWGGLVPGGLVGG